MRRFDLKSLLRFFRLRRRRIAVIPAVNCKDTPCVVERLSTLRPLGFKYVHLDVADGAFAPASLLMESGAPDAVKEHAKGMFIEVHLMVTKPLLEIDRWVAAGVRRVLIHVETLGIREFTDNFFALKKKHPRLEIGVSILPETDAEEAVPYVAVCGFAQCLAVHPGYSGQTFITGAIEKVEYLRRDLPACVIEIDGGITPELATRAREAGADIVVSGAYLWDAPDFMKAYAELRHA